MKFTVYYFFLLFRCAFLKLAITDESKWQQLREIMREKLEKNQPWVFSFVPKATRSFFLLCIFSCVSSKQAKCIKTEKDEICWNLGQRFSVMAFFCRLEFTGLECLCASGNASQLSSDQRQTLQRVLFSMWVIISICSAPWCFSRDTDYVLFFNSESCHRGRRLGFYTLPAFVFLLLMAEL